MEMNYCRRCGGKLINTNGHLFACSNGHSLYLNTSPAVGVWIVNDKNEVLVAVRAHEPGIGRLDSPGGFNDGAETAENAIARELKEELGLHTDQYTKPQYILTDIDTYPFAGEILKVLTIMFWTRLIGHPTITASDDVAKAKFVSFNDVEPSDIYLDAPRAAFIALRDSGLYNK